MIGQTIDARPTIGKSTIFWLLVALGLAAWAVIAAISHLLIASLLPLSIALALWFGRPHHAVVMVERDGLVPFGSPNKVYFSAIRAVTVGGNAYYERAERLPARPMEIHHDDGCLILPNRMNVSPAELYRFLVTQMKPRPTKPPHSLLAKYHAEQQQKFGPEKIHVIHTREVFPETWTVRRNRYVAGAILLAALLWLAIGIVVGSIKDDENYVVWVILGSLAAITSFLTYYALTHGKRSRVEAALSKHPDACMVIGPAGMAMIQGDTQGALRWDEITRVHSRVAQTFRVSGGPGLVIVVSGAEILVLDIYERSPAELEQLIRRNLDRPLAG